MRLTDRVDVVRAPWDNPVVVATLRAEVHVAAVDAVRDGLTGTVEALRAIIPPFDYQPTVHRLRWRGKVYPNDGPPMVRRRNGRDHHLAIPMRRVEG